MCWLSLILLNLMLFYGSMALFFTIRMKVLAVESSCDETAVAIYDSVSRKMTDKVYSQADLHAVYGGVVPELAARNHQEKIGVICQDVCQKAEVDLDQIDLFAYTKGPGLVGPLLIGCAFTKGLAIACDKPVMTVHHLEAHLCIAAYEQPALNYPFIGLLVSGGHTAIILAKSLGSYELLGETLDDAAGEAFDTGAKILGLSYPGGPEIARAAAQVEPNTALPILPIPMRKNKGLDFSFSGLKTAFHQQWQKEQNKKEMLGCYAKALESTIAEALADKVKRAMARYPGLDWVVAGGVAANKVLRSTLARLAQNHDCALPYPSLHYCTDNAAMIAYTAYKYYDEGLQREVCAKDVLPRWPIDQL